MAEAAIRWIGGPVLKALVDGRFHVHEAVQVGERKLLESARSLLVQELAACENTLPEKIDDQINSAVR